MKPNKLVSLSVVLVVLTLPIAAFAAPEIPAPAPGEPIDQWLRRVFYVTISAAVATTARKIWNYFTHKESTQKVAHEVEKVAKALNVHALVQQLAKHAKDYVDELGHQAAKAGKTYTSAMKENDALVRGLELLERYGMDLGALKREAEVELRKVILAQLGATRHKA